MKKLALVAAVGLVGALVGCQDDTPSATASTNSTLSGVAAFRSGTATAFAADSTKVGSAPIKSDSTFDIDLPNDGRFPVLVRIDSAGHRLDGFVPKERHHAVRIDSASHKAVDSLRKAHKRPEDLGEKEIDSARACFAPHDTLKPPHHPGEDSLKPPPPVPGSDSLKPPHHPGEDSLKPPPPPPPAKDSLKPPHHPGEDSLKPPPPPPPAKDSTKPVPMDSMMAHMGMH